jgi:hypothetical protein
MQRSNHRPSFIGELQPSGSHWQPVQSPNSSSRL